jgi:type II secretory pathway pseudopilin PulG
MTRRRGFTLGETVVSIAAVGALGAVFQPVKDGVGQVSLRFKDADQLGENLDAHVMWAAMNRGAYPLPSNVDTFGETVDVGQQGDPTLGVQLNNTSHIFSILIFNGLAAPETFISPAENNKDVSAHTAYEYRNPETAVDPAHAQWDPAFHATPNPAWNNGAGGDATSTNNNDAQIGNSSYAQNPALGVREPFWMDTGDPDHVVLGNRGPSYEGVANYGWMPAKGTGGTLSNTLKFYGPAPRNYWRGNVAYNDGRVDFETEPAPDDLLWTFPHYPPDKNEYPDNLFVNEDRGGSKLTDDQPGHGQQYKVIQGSKSFQGEEASSNAYLRPIGSVDGHSYALGSVGIWVD